MNEAFLGKKSVSNHRSLAQSDEEVASIIVQFIQKVNKMGGSPNYTEYKYY
jgi:hypothetical protein